MLEHRTSQLVAFLTFVLLLIGGLVNPTGSSLACPEPTLVCHGQLFPEMTGGVLYEHGHRLAAMSVGLLQIALTVLLWIRRKDLRGVALATLSMVCIQGLLGAITVKYKLPWFVSLSHLALANLYLVTLLWVSHRTRPMGSTQPPKLVIPFARSWILVPLVATFLQILLGGLVRHTGAWAASIQWPLHDGEIWPAGPFALKVHMLHRIAGVLLATAALTCSLRVLFSSRVAQEAKQIAFFIPFLVLLQIVFGFWIIASGRSVTVVMLHFADAIAMLALWWKLWLVTRPVQTKANSVVMLDNGLVRALRS